MGRVNKTIGRVFINTVGGEGEKNPTKTFIDVNSKLPSVSEKLATVTAQYENLFGKVEPDINKLALMEEIIIQCRIRENLDNLKVSVLRDYVYARTPFYRRDRDANDIRVLVGRTEFFDTVDGNLYGNETFMETAKTKLGEVMDSTINENLRILETM